MVRVLVLLVILSSARPARADVSSAVYGDVRDVIEELIKTEVTTSVVRTVEQRTGEGIELFQSNSILSRESVGGEYIGKRENDRPDKQRNDPAWVPEKDHPFPFHHGSQGVPA